MKFIVKNFLRGVLFAAPIYLTFYILFAMFRWVDGLGNSIFAGWVGPGIFTKGLGFILTVLLITAIGYLSSHWFGALLLGGIESLISRSALLKGIYGTIRDTLHSFLGEEKFFTKPVIVDFPNQGHKRIGFLTRENFEPASGGDEQVVVYLPQSFQVSGDMVIVPRKYVTPLDMPPEAALKMILSGGIVKEEK